MQRFAVVVVVVASALIWAPATALAKGAIPSEAVLRGPDVGDEGMATLDRATALDLADGTSLLSILGVIADAPRPVRREPSGALGPQYRVTFRLGPEGIPARQRLYPFAEHGPIAYTPPGPRVCGRCRRVSGWFDMRSLALDVLAAYRVPVPSSLRSSTWPRARDALGLSIAYPPSWRAAPSTLTPVLADPIVPLAVGTAAMVPQKLGECDIVPQHAVEAVGPTDALIAVYLYQRMASWSSDLERPQRFGSDLPWRTGPVQCTDGNTDVTVRTLNFHDGAKRLSVLVVVGKDATPQREAEVYAVLDSLHVD
jgi:hypothetical protein